MILIIDYGMCNLGSIINMFKKIGVPAKASSEAKEIEAADKIILPGIGAFDTGMQHLKDLNLLETLNEKVLNQKVPVLGLCLGMQLLTERSEEGVLPGLGWISGETVRFRFDAGHANLKVPHMGWNTVTICRENPLFRGLEQDARFYFDHAYYVVSHSQHDALAITSYGNDFVSSVHRDNLWGTQFHPEKSHRFGMKLLKNFAEIV